ncbi:MAG: hypothetical protein IPK04_11435 [Bdellovibrionales bacterium]|nr:hypothetical protein [Bdellovibrionales bacterium]
MIKAVIKVNIILAVVGVFQCVSLSASAFFSVQNLETSIKRIIQNGASSKTKVSGPDCANLAGKWTGTCENNGERTKEAILVEQYKCQQLVVVTSLPSEDSHRTTFDLTGVGLGSQSTTTANSSVGQMVAAKWSADNQVVLIEGAAIVNSPFMGSPQHLAYSVQIMLDGAEMVSFAKVTGADIGNGDRTCRYSRTP